MNSCAFLFGLLKAVLSAEKVRPSDGPQQLSLEHEREQEVAVSVLVEEHDELVAVVALNGAFSPTLAHDAGADREWLGGGQLRGAYGVVVVTAAARSEVVLAKVREQE